MSGSILSAALTAQWIFMSAAVIVFNKYILSGDTNWPFPLALTVSHMTVGSICSWALLLSGLVPGRGSVSPRDFATSILPIAGLFAVVLWLGNAAYLYLSVAFIQMTKAVMPAAVFLVGVCAGLEVYSDAKLRILLLICAGVVIASTGELDDRFQLFGFLIQLAACVAEAVRLALVQVLLQRRGLKLNAVATVAYVAPASLCFLLPFFFANEWSLLATWPHRIGSGVLLLNCFAAFGLNLSVFLLVGRTSALTMNLGGIVKDWLLILLSWAWMGAAISGITMAGYLVAFCGLLAFNAGKLGLIPGAHRPASDGAIKAFLVSGDNTAPPESSSSNSPESVTSAAIRAPPGEATDGDPAGLPRRLWEQQRAARLPVGRGGSPAVPGLVKAHTSAYIGVVAGKQLRF